MRLTLRGAAVPWDHSGTLHFSGCCRTAEPASQVHSAGWHSSSKKSITPPCPLNNSVLCLSHEAHSSQTWKQTTPSALQSHASYSRCGLGSEGTDRLVALVRAEQAAALATGKQPVLFGAKITGGGSGGKCLLSGSHRGLL